MPRQNTLQGSNPKIYRKLIANRCYGVWLSKEPLKPTSFGACFVTPNATALLFFNFKF